MKIVVVQAYALNAKVKGSFLRNCQMKMQRGRGWLQKTWRLDSPRRMTFLSLSLSLILLFESLIFQLIISGSKLSQAS